MCFLDIMAPKAKQKPAGWEPLPWCNDEVPPDPDNTHRFSVDKLWRAKQEEWAASGALEVPNVVNSQREAVTGVHGLQKSTATGATDIRGNLVWQSATQFNLYQRRGDVNIIQVTERSRRHPTSSRVVFLCCPR